MCSLCDVQPGQLIIVDTSGARCMNCSLPANWKRYVNAIYEGHTFIDGILYSQSRYEHDRICPRCNSTIRHCYLVCDDGGISQRFEDFISENINHGAQAAEMPSRVGLPYALPVQLWGAPLCG